MKIGDRIKEQRLLNNLTLEELGKEMNLNKSTILKYEKGDISIPSDKIEKLSKIFNVSPAYLMGWNIENNSNKFLDTMKKFENDFFSDEELKDIELYISFIKSRRK